MNRRSFIQTIAAGCAAVGIGGKVAAVEPEPIRKLPAYQPLIAGEDIQAGQIVYVDSYTAKCYIYGPWANGPAGVASSDARAGQAVDQTYNPEPH